MRTIAKHIAVYRLRSMKLLAIVILFAASSYAQTFESRTVNLVSGTPPDLEAYQANIKGYEWTLRNGAAAINLAGKTPFMLWYREPFSASVVTARVAVVSETGGIFRATFQPSDLNPAWFTNATSGSTNLRYAVGVEYSGGDESINHGRFRLIADPGAAGAVGVTFFSTNLNWSLINWTGLPSYLLDAPTDGGTYARKDAAWYAITGYATGGQWAADIAAALVGVATGSPVYEISGLGTDSTARAWAQAGSNKAAAAYGWGNHASAGYATGAPIYSLSGYATGTPIYTESDPIYASASTGLLTKVQASALYATGTPIYAVSGLGTDDTARAWALGASNRADAAYVLAANAATGTPIYSVAGLATGTPIYSVAGLATGTPIYSVAGLATGTPLYVESNPSLAPLSNGVANAITTGSLALAVANAASNLAAGAAGWGNHATNKYAVQGGNITGRWFALYNTQSGEKSFMGGGQGNSSISDYSAAVGGKDNISSGNYSFSGGGALNEASGNYSVVPGGRQVRALNEGAFAAGGAYNEVNGDYGTVVGGAFNTATQQAFAAGIAADATNYGSFVFATPPPDGSGVTHFGSRGNSSFNLRAYGGVYFLAPNLWIQDTNGSTIAYFSPTGSVVRGPFQIGTNSIHYDEQGNMVATDVWIHVSRATNNLDPVRYDQFSVATSALAAAQSTIAILTQQVASLITQLPIVSNAFVTADAVITAQVAGVDTRLVLTSNYFATVKTAQDNTNVWLFAQVTNRDHIVTTSLQASVAANLSTFSTFTNGYAATITNVDAVTFGGTIKSGFMLASAWEAIRTNVAFAFSGSIAATNTAGTQNYLYYSGTNTWLHDGTSWKRWSRYDF